MSAAKTKAQGIIDENAVAVFSKSYCPYCRASKTLLSDMGAKFYLIELDQVDDGAAIQDALESMTGQRSVPNIFIAKKHIGGNSDLQAAKGDLPELLKDAGALLLLPIEEPGGAMRREKQKRPNYRIAIFCGLAAAAATWAIRRPKSLRLDATHSPSNELLTAGARVEITGKDHGDDVEKISTGTSAVPYFPRKIWLPRSGSSSSSGISPALPTGTGAAQEEEEYSLLGLGIRKVSLFRIQVYVVGLYVAKSDMGKLQEELVRASVGSGASTLVQGEKQELRKTLLDGEGSSKVWGEVLKEGGVRSAIRVVPTRNTNFSHLRDGWVRGIDLRGKGKEFEGEDFQASVADFKGMFGGRGSVGKGRVLLLGRGADGALSAWLEEEPEESKSEGANIKKSSMTLLGGLKDERLSRLVWLGYLAGENVASDEARQNVVEGVMEIVERPIGTVETQVL